MVGTLSGHRQLDPHVVMRAVSLKLQFGDYRRAFLLLIDALLRRTQGVDERSAIAIARSRHCAIMLELADAMQLGSRDLAFMVDALGEALNEIDALVKQGAIVDRPWRTQARALQEAVLMACLKLRAA